MRVMLISANTETINMPTPPVGLACVAVATEAAGHDLCFIDLLGKEDPLSSLEADLVDFRPEAIGVSIRNIDDQNMASPRFLLENTRAVVSLCKAHSGAPVVLGGAGYSLFPESALAFLGADMGIQGDGEAVFPLLLDRLAAGADLDGVPGLYVQGDGCRGKRGYEIDLDRFALPDPGLFPADWSHNPHFWLPVQTRRGCPLDCSYCATRTIEGRRIRRRSPGMVVQWLKQLRQAGFGQFFFVDNTFNLPPSYAQQLCEQIAGAGLDLMWRCILYPGKVTPTLVAAMARAGCVGVSLGFESGCGDILDRMNKRFSPAHVRQACRMLADAGIATMGFLLLGGPGETRKSVEESLGFVDALNLEMLKVTAGIRIYPDTALAGIAAAEGVVTFDDDLLRPRFYLARGLGPWLVETLGPWMARRPYVMH